MATGFLSLQVLASGATFKFREGLAVDPFLPSAQAAKVHREQPSTTIYDHLQQ